jgi:hypothetical protein
MDYFILVTTRLPARRLRARELLSSACRTSDVCFALTPGPASKEGDLERATSIPIHFFGIHLGSWIRLRLKSGGPQPHGIT